MQHVFGWNTLGTVLRSAGLVLAALLVLAGSTLAADGSAPSTPNAAAEAQPADPTDATPAAPAHSHQMRAHIDPETGGLTLRPMPIQLSEALQNALSRSDEGLRPVTLPNGTQLLHLQGRFQSLSVARLGDQGLETACSHDDDTVRSFLAGTTHTHAPANR